MNTINFPSLDVIKIKRKRIGLTQKQLAQAAHVSQSLVAKIEFGMVAPSYLIAIRIFQALEDAEIKESKTARDVLNPKILSVKLQDSILTTISMMKKAEISQLPVMEKEAVVGVVSESDVLAVLTGSKKEPSLIKVQEVMKEAPPQVSISTPISAIAPLLAHSQIVIVQAKGKPAGVITKSDLLTVLSK